MVTGATWGSGTGREAASWLSSGEAQAHRGVASTSSLADSSATFLLSLNSSGKSPIKRHCEDGAKEGRMAQRGVGLCYSQVAVGLDICTATASSRA